MSALPSSRHSATLALICSRTSALISPVSPEKSARKPWVRLLMTSISCRVTVCTTSLRFCSSPSGHCTNLVWGPMAS
uniref:Putative secreted protein n=1 Tax=Ixodes ricinus TaxID=34613 RepID=A0A6B0U339_IXORI